MPPYLTSVDISEELVDLDEGFLLLGVFDLVGDTQVDPESKIPGRRKRFGASFIQREIISYHGITIK